MTSKDRSKPAPTRISRIFDALQCLERASNGLTLSQLAEQLKIAPSSAHDLLSALTAADVVAEHGDRRYTLGPRAINLALSIVGSLEPIRLADPDAQHLCERTGEDVLLAVRSGDEVVYAIKHNGTTPLKVDVRLGSPRPLHATSVGKLFVAHDEELYKVLARAKSLPRLTPDTITDRRELERELETTRRNSFAVSSGEAIAGVLGFAAPVFGADGSLVVAVHVSLPTQRATPDHLRTLIAETALCASESTRRLGGASAAPQPDLPERVIERLEGRASLPTATRAPHASSAVRAR
jgi:DNA-binding IclR family transcriptional regulator